MMLCCTLTDNEISGSSSHPHTVECACPKEAVTSPDLPHQDSSTSEAVVAGGLSPARELDSYRTPPSQDDRLPDDIFATVSSDQGEEHGETGEQSSVGVQQCSAASNKPSSSEVLPSDTRRKLVSLNIMGQEFFRDIIV